MKKVLALVLAVLMMATVAMAVNYVPGQKIKFGAKGIVADKVLAVSDDAEGKTPATTAKPINSDNYSISKITWNNGKALVESVKFDDAADQLVIKLKQDYTMYKEKVLDGNVKLKEKKTTSTYFYAVIEKDSTVSYTKTVVALDNGTDLDTAIKAGNLVEFDKAKDGTAYGDVYLNTGIADVTVRVYDGEKYFLAYNNDANTAVLKANADVDAERMDFIAWDAEPTFNATAKVYFYDTEKTDNIYVIKDGKVSKSNAKWSEDDACYVLSTRTLGSYVVTDAKLSTAAADSTPSNPDTGANDVVGIATALAAVALVSAAAVSLKK